MFLKIVFSCVVLLATLTGSTGFTAEQTESIWYFQRMLQWIQETSYYDTRLALEQGTKEILCTARYPDSKSFGCDYRNAHPTPYIATERVLLGLAKSGDRYARIEPSMKELDSCGTEVLAVPIGEQRRVLLIRLTSICLDTAQQISSALESQRIGDMSSFEGIVLDLSNCPGGEIASAYEVSDLFLKVGLLMGSIQERDSKPLHKYSETSNAMLEQLSLVLVTGPPTASAAEIIIWALQDNGRVDNSVGTPTCAKGVFQNKFTVPRVGHVLITQGHMIRRDGSKYDTLCYLPNILVHEADAVSAVYIALDLFRRAHLVHR